MRYGNKTDVKACTRCKREHEETTKLCSGCKGLFASVREFRVQNGLCVKCGTTRDNETVLCSECRNRRNEVQRSEENKLRRRLTRSKYKSQENAYRRLPHVKAKARARAAMRRQKPSYKKYWDERGKIIQKLARRGLTIDDFNKMLELQGGKCATCGDIPKKICIDHDHITGKVRQLLCNGCNTSLGMVKERPEVLRALASYLERHAI